MKEIVLTKGKFTLVDEEDYDELTSMGKWYAQRNNGNKYYAAKRCKINKNLLLMHRIILRVSDKKLDVDHINGNSLDNRKCNLRTCNRSQNNMNMEKTRGISKYKGVSWNKKSKKWEAYIQIFGKHKYLGSFDNEIKAARTYDNAAKEYFKEFARLNFSEEHKQ